MSIIAITDHFDEAGQIEKDVLGSLVGTDVGPETEVLLVWHERIDEAFVSGLPRLKGVQRYGVGYDNLDVAHLAARNILCCNNPDYGVDEVSDTAMAFILSFSRGIHRYDAMARSLTEGWQEHVIGSLRRHSSLTLGVIGAGRIGSAVLQKSRAMGFNTSFFDPYVPSGWEKVLRSRRTQTLEQLLTESDIVSIHCPLTPETTGLVDDRFISTMKKGSCLVNTARGGIVLSLDVLHHALESNRLAGVGLDVLPQEPPVDTPLLREWRERASWLADRLLINPHTAYYSAESGDEIRRKAAENALRMYQDEAPLNRLIPHG